jgi:hypothetical protein
MKRFSQTEWEYQPSWKFSTAPQYAHRLEKTRVVPTPVHPSQNFLSLSTISLSLFLQQRFLFIIPEFPILTKNSDFNEDKAVLKDTKIKFKTMLCRQAIALTEKEKVF